MPDRKKKRKKQTGLLPYLPLAFALPGTTSSILGLILPFAARLTKNPYTGKIKREAMTLSEWGRSHDALREIGSGGYSFFGAARGLVWTVAVTAGIVLLLLVVSRFARPSRELCWTVVILGVLLALASVVCFVCSVLFAVSLGSDATRVLLLVGAYLPLAGGLVSGVSAFFAVRRQL